MSSRAACWKTVPTEPREPKPEWRDVPPPLREKLSALAGEAIAGADIAWGGYGPSATFVLTTASGRRLFCKGTHPGQTELGHRALIRERENYMRFPELAGFGPAYLGGADHENWHMAMLDYAPRRCTVPPWTQDTLMLAIRLVARFHAETPARAAAAVRPLNDLMAEQMRQGWRSLLGDAAARGRFLALFEDARGAAHWLSQHGERLAALEASATGVGGPRSWLHMDIRSDNLIFADRLLLVDWPNLTYGATLIDVAGFVPSVEGEGGPRCADMLLRYEQAAGMRFDAEDVTAAAAFVAGFFAARAGEPEISALPRLRGVQKRQLVPALTWLCGCLAIDAPSMPHPAGA